MSTSQPQGQIDNLPLDLFDEKDTSLPAAPEPVTPSVQVESPPADAAPDPGWAQAGVVPDVDLASGLPRRLRRTYDIVGFVALWLLLSVTFGGVLLRPRLVVMFFVAGIIYVALMRHGANRGRFHGFLNRFRTWVTSQ